MVFIRLLLALIVLGSAPLPASAQSLSSPPSAAATLRGTVTLPDGKPIHNVLITVIQLKRTVNTNDDGQFEITGLPPGKYDVVAHLDRVPDVVKTADLSRGGAATLDFQIELSGLREQVTITATGTEQAVSSSIQSDRKSTRLNSR